MYLMVAGTLAVVYLFPLLTKAVPSASVAIIMMTLLSISMNLDLCTVGDMGEITQTLPFFHIPDITLSLEALWFLLPHSLALAVVATSDMAIGVVAGVGMSALVFEWKSAKIRAHGEVDGDGAKVYRISGRLFFGMMIHFVDLFDYKNDPDSVTIDFGSSHVWDHSAVKAITKIVRKYEQLDKKVTIGNLNQESKRLVEQVGLASLTGH
ncbi:STAS domain-containing protein [Brevibacillus fluminis]|uniref:STAS domain-containing protein n=1 Tax=Brevibacillus fluminis TaxID=511487 RepID=UPI003F8B66EE